MVVAHQNQQQPTSVIVPEAVVQQRGCRYSVPSNASSAVKNTRRISIFIIIIHIIAAYSWPLQWIGCAIGIVTGSVVLCSFNKCTYTAAGVLYILGFIADACAGGIVIAVIIIFNVGSEYHDYGTPLGLALLLTVPPMLGALAFLAGSVFAFKAVCNWEQSGALRAVPVYVEHPAAATGLQAP